MVGRPSRRSGNGREAHPVVQEWSGGPHGGPGLVGRPPKGPLEVGTPSRWSGSDW